MVTELKHPGRQRGRTTAAEQAVNAHAAVRNARSLIEQVDEVKVCINTMKYAGKPLPIRLSDEGVDFIKMLLIAHLKQCEQELPRN